jgi:hypothetical protein
VTPVQWSSKVDEVAASPGSLPPALQSLRWSLVVATLLLLWCSGIPNENSRNSNTPHVAEVSVVKPLEPELKIAPLKPDAPVPKATLTDSKAELDLIGGADPGSAAVQPALSAPVKPASTESYETPTQRKIWYGLVVAGHGTAVFDAWTTRRAVSSGYGVEGDPLQRPFANSGAIYASTQVAPLIMDYLGRRMMRSRHPWVRKAWWVPQSASAAVSLTAGVHNYGVVP